MSPAIFFLYCCLLLRCALLVLTTNERNKKRTVCHPHEHFPYTQRLPLGRLATTSRALSRPDFRLLATSHFPLCCVPVGRSVARSLGRCAVYVRGSPPCGGFVRGCCAPRFLAHWATPSSVSGENARDFPCSPLVRSSPFKRRVLLFRKHFRGGSFVGCVVWVVFAYVN